MVFAILSQSERRDDRAAEGARLESVCTLITYRGFESLSLRQESSKGFDKIGGADFGRTQCANPSLDHKVNLDCNYNNQNPHRNWVHIQSLKHIEYLINYT